MKTGKSFGSADDPQGNLRRALERPQEGTNSLDQLKDGFEHMIVGDFSAQMLPEELNKVEPGRVGWQGEEQQLIGIALQKFAGLLTVVDAEVVYDQHDLLSVTLRHLGDGLHELLHKGTKSGARRCIAALCRRTPPGKDIPEMSEGGEGISHTLGIWALKE